MRAPTLIPCPQCSRHVRDDAAACPFCASPARPDATGVWGRLGAGAMLAMAASAALHACYGAPCTASDPTCGGTYDRDAMADAMADAVSDTAGDVATGDGPRTRAAGTVNVIGTVNGAAVTATDIAFEATASGCGGASGVLLATSGAAIACGAPLATSIQRPYLRMRASRREVGTYTLVADGACTDATADRVFTASWDGAAGSTVDVATGVLVITASTAQSMAGTFTLTLSGAATNTITGEFTATPCPP